MDRTTLAQQAKTESFLPPAQGLFQRNCNCGQKKSSGSGECTDCKRKHSNVQRKSVNHADQSEVPSIVGDVLRSPGLPLDQSTREYIEPRFGHHFSHVRVHLDGKAAKSARALNALAYTVGNDVVFDAGQYAPHNVEGRRLLAHELTHTLQQSSLGSKSQRKLRINEPGDEFEQEAERVAEHVTRAPDPNYKYEVSQVKIHNNLGGFQANLQRQVDDVSSGGPVRNRCVLGLGCPAITHCGGKPCAVTDCGTGSCPFCPPGFENLVIRAWCVYSCAPTGSAFILITRGFDIHIGPICLD